MGEYHNTAAFYQFVRKTFLSALDSGSYRSTWVSVLACEQALTEAFSDPPKTALNFPCFCFDIVCLHL